MQAVKTVSELHANFNIPVAKILQQVQKPEKKKVAKYILGNIFLKETIL